VRIYHEIRDFPGQASANNNLGMCYHLQGVLDGALYHYQVALRTDEHVGDLVDAVIVKSNIGEVLMAQGRLEEALGYLDKVVSAHASTGELPGVTGLAHVNIARCRALQGDGKAADLHLRRAKRLLREVGQQGLLVEAELQRADLSLAEGRHKSALRVARSGLRHAREIGAGLLEARAERLVGQALIAAGSGHKALLHLRSSIALARKTSARHEEARTLLVRGRLECDAGRVRAGSRLLGRAGRLFSEIGSRLEAEEARALLEAAN
jgi:tetratricopeptide (TPR) repeat protein